MNSVICVSCDVIHAYEEYNFRSRIRDRFKVASQGESFIKELGIKIAQVKLPPNFNNLAYTKNMERVKGFIKRGNVELAPKTFRNLDYNILSDYQKSFFAYSVVKSVQLMLRVRNKSIKNSCIVVFDAKDVINKSIIFELAKVCKYLVLLSEKTSSIRVIGDYLIANYGISPVVSNDFIYALNSADFVITSREIKSNVTCPVWCLDNTYKPEFNKSKFINDVFYSVPWQIENREMSIELLGAVLSIMGERDVERSLNSSGIYIDKIKFNDTLTY